MLPGFDRPAVMAILNATPDSFSDGGLLSRPDKVAARIDQVLEEGADVLDVGGESTRPGHRPVSVQEELGRVVPVIKAIRAVDAQIPVSIDTSKAEVAEAALAAGATFINDVRGGAETAPVAAAAGCLLVVMRDEDCHGDIVEAARSQLAARVAACHDAGVADTRIIIDPGLGFGERPGPVPEDNMALIDRLAEYATHPVLIGASRKRFVQALGDQASVDVAVRAVQAGAAVLRVHDVGPTVEALRL